MIRRLVGAAAVAWGAGLVFLTGALAQGAGQAAAQGPPAVAERPTAIFDRQPWEYGVVVQSGFGVTEQRGGFKFLWGGVHAGKVLSGPIGKGAWRGNFEYAVEAWPLWQSYTPKFIRANCVAIPSPPGAVTCSAPFTVGGTFSGVSVTPIILRWNLDGTRRFSFWGQAAGGLLWTNHKYPAFGGPPYDVQNDGPNADASVWNFTPQGGIGVHFFLRPKAAGGAGGGGLHSGLHSVDLGANAIHISSASLGDRNPGVNASVQFTLGYTWWK